MKLGLFLTPGAARAAYQVGAVDVLCNEAHLRFDVIAASSVGALNGAFVAMDEIQRLIEIWSQWTTEGVMRTDLIALLRRGIFWAPSLASNEPEHESAIRPYVREARLRPGVRFRFNLANLQTGESEIVEYPGGKMPMPLAVGASVAVPVMFPPTAFEGTQYADGLTIDGFPLEDLLLGTGVERAFVVGVAPRAPLGPCPNAYQAALRASEWNQYFEALDGLERAAATNRVIAGFAEERAQAARAITEEVADPALRAELLAELDRRYQAAAFPHARGPVEIVPILPAEEFRMAFGDFKPERSRALIERGRADARAMLARLS